jgi:predicted NBD/HSP70 family sugar kinase
MRRALMTRGLYDDSDCAYLSDTAAKAIANLIMNLARTTDPDTVALGGGVVSDGFLYPRILAALAGLIGAVWSQ